MRRSRPYLGQGVVPGEVDLGEQHVVGRREIPTVPGDLGALAVHDDLPGREADLHPATGESRRDRESTPATLTNPSRWTRTSVRTSTSGRGSGRACRYRRSAARASPTRLPIRRW